jgi:hypothetical protein
LPLQNSATILIAQICQTFPEGHKFFPKAWLPDEFKSEMMAILPRPPRHNPRTGHLIIRPNMNRNNSTRPRVHVPIVPPPPRAESQPDPMQDLREKYQQIRPPERPRPPDAARPARSRRLHSPRDVLKKTLSRTTLRKLQNSFRIPIGRFRMRQSSGSSTLSRRSRSS